MRVLGLAAIVLAWCAVAEAQPRVAQVCAGALCAVMDARALEAQLDTGAVATALVGEAAQAAAGWWARHGFTVAFSASLGCETADLATTMYYVGQGTLIEANPALAPFQHEPLKFNAAKMGVAGLVNGTGYALHRQGHRAWAQALLFANAALKCVVAVGNDRRGRGL